MQPHSTRRSNIFDYFQIKFFIESLSINWWFIQKNVVQPTFSCHVFFLENRSKTTLFRLLVEWYQCSMLLFSTGFISHKSLKGLIRQFLRYGFHDILKCKKQFLGDFYRFFDRKSKIILEWLENESILKFLFSNHLEIQDQRIEWLVFFPFDQRFSRLVRFNEIKMLEKICLWSFLLEMEINIFLNWRIKFAW
jgi:hypothetical protein